MSAPRNLTINTKDLTDLAKDIGAGPTTPRGSSRDFVIDDRPLTPGTMGYMENADELKMDTLQHRDLGTALGTIYHEAHVHMDNEALFKAGSAPETTAAEDHRVITSPTFRDAARPRHNFDTYYDGIDTAATRIVERRNSDSTALAFAEEMRNDGVNHVRGFGDKSTPSYDAAGQVDRIDAIEARHVATKQQIAATLQRVQAAAAPASPAVTPGSPVHSPAPPSPTLSAPPSPSLAAPAPAPLKRSASSELSGASRPNPALARE